MKIVVCVKEIADPDVASSVFSINEATQEIGPGVRFVISPFDAQAIELALRIRDTANDTFIMLLTLGDESARSIMKYGLSLGADEAVMLIDSAFERGDSFTTARALAAAIAKIGNVDLVLAGRQAADGDCGVVGLGIAELLELPAITFAMNIELAGQTIVVERALVDGSETVETAMPAVVTVSHEVGKVRQANLRETMKAARKMVTIWTAADLGLTASQVGASGIRRAVERLYVPVSGVQCEFIAGATPEEQMAKLVERLATARLFDVQQASGS